MRNTVRHFGSRFPRRSCFRRGNGRWGMASGALALVCAETSLGQWVGTPTTNPCSEALLQAYVLIIFLAVALLAVLAATSRPSGRERPETIETASYVIYEGFARR
jgi:hypothetical protein